MNRLAWWWRYLRTRATGRTIDMRHKNLTWGWNLSQIGLVGKRGIRLSIWIPTQPVVGDEIQWDTAAGQEVSGLVTRVEPAPGVWDLSTIDVWAVTWKTIR